MKSIIEDIKNKKFKKVYLLYGEETYLKIQFRDKLCNALNREDTMNYSEFRGKGQDEGQIIDLAETMPFFSDHRMILLQDTGFFKNKTGRLADYMAELPDYICMVFVESDVDKRGRMYKAVRKYGRVVEFAAQNEKTLTRWVLGILKKENKKITKSNMELFLSMTGTDMGNIEQELEKLISYTMGRDIITTEDINTICTAQITNQIFDMVRAVTARQQKKALDLYYDLLSLKEPPMKILALIAREFNMMLQVKNLQLEGCDTHMIALHTGLRDFVVRKYLPLTRSYSTTRLQSAMDDCISTETDVKTGRLTDVLSVELLIIRYSSKMSY